MREIDASSQIGGRMDYPSIDALAVAALSAAHIHFSNGSCPVKLLGLAQAPRSSIKMSQSK